MSQKFRCSGRIWCAGGVFGLLVVIAARRRRTTGNRVVSRLRGDVAGLRYRLGRNAPDPAVSDLVLADRVRSSIGTLEHRLDIPHVHVMVNKHVVTLHGDVPTQADIEALTAHIAEISGVRAVCSYLHVGLLPSDTRPSSGRNAPHPPSTALRGLLDAARSAGAADAPLFAVHAVLNTFLERVPTGERDHVLVHLPDDVQRLVRAPHRRGEQPEKVQTLDQVYAAVVAADPLLDHERSVAVTRSVLAELDRLVPEEHDDIAAVLPHQLRDMWEHLG